MTDSIIKSTSFEALILRRNGMLEKISKARELCMQADTMSEGMCTVSAALTGTLFRREMCITDEHALETVQKRIDAAAWAYLMSESGLKSLMDAEARDAWEKNIRECKVPELTILNIHATFEALHGSRSEMFERGVINVFENLSWHYKTNQPQKFGKRIILNYLGQPGFSMDIRRSNQIDDLGRVFHVMDGKPEADHRNGYGMAVGTALRKRDTSFDCPYFSMRMFKKGSAHLTFKRLDLVDRMNSIVAKHYPGALPEPK